jgi:hypothetical protein
MSFGGMLTGGEEEVEVKENTISTTVKTSDKENIEDAKTIDIKKTPTEQSIGKEELSNNSKETQK